MYESLAKLYAMATGGSAVAASPGEGVQHNFPDGPSPAGIDLVITWFEQERKKGSQVFLFLVGGPGGGKSHVSAKLVEGFEEINPSTKSLAHRSYLYETPTGRLLLVNDATIKREGAERGYLKEEIAQSLQNGQSLIACVNRGILLEESAFADGTEIAASSIIDWVSGGRNEITTLSNPKPTEYIKFGHLHTSENIKVKFGVVYVDVCSLLEKLPESSYEASDHDAVIKAAPYGLTQFHKRSSLEPDQVPALQLIKQVIAEISNELPEDIESTNPILANIANLSNETYLKGVGTILRASEIASGQRYSYREIWGIIARLVLGDLTKTIDSANLQAHIDSKSKLPKDSSEAFFSLKDLARLRAHQAVFDIQNDELVGASGIGRDGIDSLMCLIDPIKDSASGVYDALDPNSGWADYLMDAFSGAIAGTSPLKALLDLCKQNADDAFTECVTSFDRKVDELFTTLMEKTELQSDLREKATRWYSSYLSRLYCFANGIPAFRSQVSTWIDMAKSVPVLQTLQEKQILTVIRPANNPADQNSPSIIPLFDSRTLPIVGYSLEPKLGLELDSMKVKTERIGDELFLIVEEHSEIVARILLDFPMIREISAAADGYLGITDLSNFTTPRLERLRSSRLSSKLLGSTIKYSIVTGSNSFSVVRQD